MKNIIIGFVVTIIALLCIQITLTVNARQIRQQEVTDALDAALEGTINVLAKKTYNIDDKSEYIADLVMGLSSQIDSNSDVSIKILDADYDKGLLSVQVTETFKHVNGKEGKVVANKTVLLEKKQYNENTSDTNLYTIQFILPDKTVYKHMELPEGTLLYEPVNPYPEENINWISNDTDISFPFSIDSDKIIELKIN